MNLAEIRTAARAITDLDEGDISDSIVNGYIKDGYQRFMSLERRWPWLETSYTLTALAGVSAYPLSTIGNVREITAVQHEDTVHGLLTWVGHDAAHDHWYASTSSVPREWSKWAGSIYLWPRPETSYQLAARGYREPVDWTASDAVEVDADDPFHRPLVDFAVAQMYQQQEDLELSAFYRRSFDEAIHLARAEAMRVPQSSPLILHGGLRRRRYWRPQIAA